MIVDVNQSEGPRKTGAQKKQRSILVVYDDREVTAALGALFKGQGYFVSAADDGLSAVDIFVAMGGFDLVLSRLNLPDVDEEALRRMISDLYPRTSFLFFEQIHAFQGPTGNFLRLQMKDITISGGELLELVGQVFSGGMSSNAKEFTEKDQLKRCLLSVISLFSAYLEQYEFVTGGKGRFIKELAVSVARQIGLPSDMTDEIAFASLVFDIGMVKVSPKVKLKPGNLTEDELTQIKSHCFYGAEIVEKMRFPWNVQNIVLHHHERYDGKGYPRGLKGREIPIGARIVSVADGYYAMTSRRPNRPPLTNRQAAEELRKGAGTQFDPEVVEIFLSLIRKKGLEEHETETSPKVVLLAGFSDYAGPLVASRFDQAGHLTIQAWSLQDLKEKLETAPPDFFICDAEGIGTSGEAVPALRSKLGVGQMHVLWLADTGSVLAKSLTRDHSELDHFMARPARLQELVAEVNTILLRCDFAGMNNGKPATKEAYGIHGNLIELDIIEIVQMLHQGMKTAEVTITTGDEVGKVFFAAGHVRHVEFRGRTGDPAFYEIVKVRDGTFVIEHTRTPPTVTIDKRTDFLLLEAIRLMDEENRESGGAEPSADLSRGEPVRPVDECPMTT